MKKFKNSQLSTDSRKLQTLALNLYYQYMKRCKDLTDIGIDKSLFIASVLEANRLRLFDPYIYRFIC